LFDVDVSVVGAPVLVKVVLEVATIGTVISTVRLLKVVLINFLLDGWKVIALRLMRSTARMMCQ
jgi:hypothetical protein